MRKKLVGNGMWESSRMMLPEHKETILAHRERSEFRKAPVLDEQQWEALNERLSAAYRERREITVVVFGERGNIQVQGVIAKADTMRGRLLIAGRWVEVRDLIDVF